MQKYRLLVIDDEVNIRNAMRMGLKYEGFDVQAVSTGAEGLEHLNLIGADAVIVDLKMPKMDGFEFLKEAKKIDNNIPIFMLTGHGGVDEAVTAMKEGAYDFLSKPINMDHLVILLKRAIGEKHLKEDYSSLKEKISHKNPLDDLVGNSSAILSIKKIIKQIAKTDTTVLISGNSGTGKEIVASCIHYLSDRKNGPFIKVNCAALSESILESELFGHEKGAFTGAETTHKGRFELANNGTIFLDEIGEISPNVQVKLLRVLQEREFERVGSEKTIQTDIRILAATNKDLKQEVKKGNFREDLYYRLNVVEIKLPALKERPEDIPLLMQYFLQNFELKYNKKNLHFTAKVISLFENYTWSGNIRQLQNAVEHCVVLSQVDEIGVENLPDYLRENEDGLNTIIIPMGSSLEDAEKKIITKTFLYKDKNKTATADTLKISRKTIDRKLKEYDIS